MKNIILTGGHAGTTAISVIHELKEKYPDFGLSWVGPKSAVEGRYVPTLAATVMPKLGVKFIPIISGRLQRRFTIWTIPSLLKIPFGFISAFQILIKTKPSLVVSFGGYASVPVSFAGWVLRIPVVIHEQTVAVGRANKVSSYFASKILVARRESEVYFPKGKTVVVGNPVSAAIASIKPKTKLGEPPMIFVTGGSSGAQRINKVVAEALYELLKKYKVVHQTGKLDFADFKDKRNLFPTDLKKNYEVYDFIDPSEIPAFFHDADLIISRAGANTLSEIMVIKRPAILIPIPWTAYNEQFKNAKLVEETGLGVVLEEKDLTAENLISKIEYVFSNWKNIVENSDSSLAELDIKAAEKFVSELGSFLQK